MSSLTPGQVSILVEQEIPDNLYLSIEVSDLLNNLLADNTDTPFTPTAPEKVLQSYLQELINTSGAPGTSTTDQNGNVLPLAPDAQPIINSGLGTLETATEQEIDSACVNGGISDYYQVGDTAAGQLANQAFVPGSLNNTISDIANQLGDGHADIINEVVSAIQNVIGAQASQNFVEDAENKNFIGFFSSDVNQGLINNDVNQASTATIVYIPAISALGGTVNGISASDFPVGGGAATLIKTFGSTPPSDSSTVNPTNDANSALTPSQVSILVGLAISGNPSLANEVSQLLDNMLANKAETLSSSEQVLQSYLQELITHGSISKSTFL